MPELFCYSAVNCSVLTLGLDPDYFLIEIVQSFLQVSFLLLYILEGVCQGLDLGFMLDNNGGKKNMNNYKLSPVTQTQNKHC